MSDSQQHEPQQAKTSAAQKLVGDLTPKLASLTDEMLFGDVWEREGLSPRDRSLVTISMLVAGGHSDQLKAHIGIGLDNGLTRQEITEVITHLAFYAGWPRAMAAVAVARQAFADADA